MLSPILCYNFHMTSESSGGTRVRASIRVRGIVQGVNYRWFTQRRAAALGLTGFVRNLPDGSVQVDVEGERASIQQLLEALRIGPAAAVVESVETAWHAPSGEYQQFEVRS
jgi:acylphosphatase